MSDNLHDRQRQMLRYLLVNLLIVMLVPAFVTVLGGFWDYLLIAIVVALLLSLFDRGYGRYLFWSFLFLAYLFKEVVVSNLVLAWIIIQPKLKLDPGIIAVPLTVTTGVEITALSLAIAATPGTLIVELGVAPEGHYVLYVHALNVGNPDQFRANIKNGFERMILSISRGATA